MRESCLYGSVRGASGDWRPYRDSQKGGQPYRGWDLLRGDSSLIELIQKPGAAKAY